MTNNKLTELNNHLFAQLDRLGNDSLDQEALEREVDRTSAIVSLSEQIISNASVAVKAAELVAKHGVGNWEKMLPGEMIEPNAKITSGTGGDKAKGIPNYEKEIIE